MIVNAKPLPVMCSGNNSNTYYSREFQPYVKLENILDKISSLTEANITVPCWPATRLNNSTLNISDVDIIKTEVKEEVISEQCDDVAPEEYISCNVDMQVSAEDHFVKSETDDDIELFLSQESDSTIVEDIMEVTSTSIDENGEDVSSLDLHLSPEHDSEIDCVVSESSQITIQNSTEDDNFSQETPLVCNCGKISPNRTRSCDNPSPDMFAESPIETPPEPNSRRRTRASRRRPSSTASSDNRERQAEWNSQELSAVSQSLALRTKQTKRFILEVIRKRQMEDETLDAFKKRLRRM